MVRSALTILTMSTLLLMHAPAYAASVEISTEQARDEISVTVSNAKADRILDALHKQYGFEIVGLANATQGEALTVKFSGNLRNVLKRLLRNRNHMIVGSSQKPGGIAKVMILNGDYGARSNRPVPRHDPANTEAAEMVQAGDEFLP
jgi:hypothetical protein